MDNRYTGQSTNFYSDNDALQTAAMGILPVKTMEKDREKCFKCKTRFQLFDYKRWCASCGEIFCAKCAESKMQVMLPHIDYARPVTTCDYCMAHLR